MANMETQFIEWMKQYPYHRYTDATISRYVRALNKAEEWLEIVLPNKVLETDNENDFIVIFKTITSTKNYEQINRSHGHGDLSAAMAAYKKFLADLPVTVDDDWWPSETEYNPGISKDTWLQLLRNETLFTSKRLSGLAAFYDNGGQGSCVELSEKYGESSEYYRQGIGVHLAEAVSRATGCPLCNQKNAKFWPVLFVGRDARPEERGSYIWKLRPELYDALTEFDISRFLPPVKLLGVFDSWEILNENTAVKTCDKSFFEHNGSGVPKDICWFFNADKLELGETIGIEFQYEGNEYTGRVTNESSDRRRVRIFWNADLGKQFAFKRSLEEVKATFTRIGENIYSVTISGGDVIALPVKDAVANIKTYIAAKGFSYADGLIENFYLSLKSKPFVILAGISGTGKTRLVRHFAEAVGATKENGRYKMVSVRPDWSDSSDLFGHVDLNGNFIPGAIIDFVKQAELDNAHPYFLCLDEMNLARVEYYLSDFLSIIETREFQAEQIVSRPLVSDTYYGGDSSAAEKYGTIQFPENLYVIGTVNMDETTFPFSKKVLDRANTIEFNDVDLTPPAEWAQTVPPALDLANSYLKAEYLLLKQCSEQQETVNAYCAELQKLNSILQQANAHVGYRVRDEVVFYLLNNKNAGLVSENEAMDNEIMQKILPRIQGSSASVKNMLCDLFKYCAGDYEGMSTESDLSAKMMKVAGKPDCRYPKSSKKIAFMVRRFEEDGFTSYWL